MAILLLQYFSTFYHKLKSHGLLIECFGYVLLQQADYFSLSIRKIDFQIRVLTIYTILTLDKLI